MKKKPRTARTQQSDYRTVRLWQVALREFIHFSNSDMKRQGVTLLQYQVMLEIAGCAAEDTPMTVGLLASHLHMRHNSVVVLINQLVRKGFARRVPSPHDRRSMLLQLTAKGKRTLDTLVRRHRRVIDSFLPELRKSLRRTPR